MGEVFAGRYELVDVLGYGGMGTVWRVVDRRDGAVRAAKVLRQSDAATLLRFVREQTLRVAHQHVVAPRGWAADDDRVLFTMDLVAGGSLATLLGDHGPLPPQWTAVLLDQLLDALTAVHRAGLVHRDVKPSNLLLEATGRARPHLRLSDFGIASPRGEPRLTMPSVVLGTPGWLSPESLAGAEPDPRQDLWAAGTCAVAMLTGDQGRGARMPMDRALPVTAPPGVPVGLWRVVRHLTEPDPADRPPTAAAARAELAETGTVPPPPAVPDDAGSEVEVFSQVPPMPPPPGTEPAPAPAAEPAPAPAADQPRARAVPGVRPGVGPDDRTVQTRLPPRPAGPSELAPSAAVGSGPAAPAVRRRDRARVGTAVGLLAVAALVLVLLVRFLATGDLVPGG